MEDSGFNRALKITDTPTGTIIDYYLPFEIKGPENFIDFLRAVRNAEENDSVILHINCAGGDLNIAFNIVDVLNNCPANIKVCVEGLCASAATFIMLAGDDIEILEHSHVMIHAWSTEMFGKWQELSAFHTFEKSWLEKNFRETYKNFLTEEEIEGVLKGQDIYLEAGEVKGRLENYHSEDKEKKSIIEGIVNKYQDIINKELGVALGNFEKGLSQKKEKTTPTKKNSSKKRG